MENALEFIVQLTADTKQLRVLDIGCGTGIYTIPLVQKLACDIVGIDRSSEMLVLARSKPDSYMVTWQEQEVTALSFDEEFVDVVFMSNLLHHFRNPCEVVMSCQRVLRPGGLLINQYTPIEDLIDDPEHRFFPECVTVDAERTLSVLKMEALLGQCDFLDIMTKSACLESFHSAQQRIASVQNKAISAFPLISDSCFENGLNQLREFSRLSPNYKWFRELRISTTCGRKSLYYYTALPQAELGLPFLNFLNRPVYCKPSKKGLHSPRLFS